MIPELKAVRLPDNDDFSFRFCALDGVNGSRLACLGDREKDVFSFFSWS